MAEEFKTHHIFYLVIFSLVLPTLDVYLNLIIACKLINNGTDLKILGQFMFIPLTLSVIFTIPHWWKVSKNISKRLIYFILVPTQLWQAFRVCRILQFYFKGKKNAAYKKKLALETTYSYTIPFMNSFPQLILQSVFIGLYSSNTGFEIPNGVYKIAEILNTHVSFYIFSLNISIICAHHGLARFLAYGPLKIFDTKGIFHRSQFCSFLIINFIVFFSMIGRHSWFFYTLQYEKNLDIVWIWLGCNVIPQLLMVSCLKTID